MLDRPLQDLLANAWVQGVIDATEFAELKRGKPNGRVDVHPDRGVAWRRAEPTRRK